LQKEQNENKNGNGLFRKEKRAERQRKSKKSPDEGGPTLRYMAQNWRTRRGEEGKRENITLGVLRGPKQSGHIFKRKSDENKRMENGYPHRQKEKGVPYLTRTTLENPPGIGGRRF